MVGARASGTEQISQRVSYFWSCGGLDQGPWLQERVGGGRRDDGSSKEGGGLKLGWLFQRGASPGARASVAGG